MDRLAATLYLLALLTCGCLQQGTGLDPFNGRQRVAPPPTGVIGRAPLNGYLSTLPAGPPPGQFVNGQFAAGPTPEASGGLNWGTAAPSPLVGTPPMAAPQPLAPIALGQPLGGGYVAPAGYYAPAPAPIASTGTSGWRVASPEPGAEQTPYTAPPPAAGQQPAVEITQLPTGTR